jgi:hypothetical protein
VERHNRNTFAVSIAKAFPPVEHGGYSSFIANTK